MKGPFTLYYHIFTLHLPSNIASVLDGAQVGPIKPLIIGPTERPSYQRGSMEGTTNSIPNIASLDHWTH